MKLRRIIAVSAAAAIAASAVAATASAITINGADSGAGGVFAFLRDDKQVDRSLFADMSVAHTLQKVVLTIKTDSFEDVMDLKDATWMGGGIGFNSESTGWAQHEWSFQDGVKELTWVANEDDETFTITLDNGAPVFATTDTYAHVWIQSWDHEPFEFEIVDFQLLNADGVDIRDIKADAPVVDEPVVDEPVVEETVEDEPVVEETIEIVESEESEDIVVVESEEIEETVEDEPVADEPVADEPAVDTDAPTTGDKQSPDTGVEGIAAVAGVVALAGAAVVASRKRK